MIKIETQTTEVEVTNNIEVISAGQVEVETVDLSNLDITVAKKEYVITGDDIYIPMLYDDAPQWMKDLVQVVVDVSISSGNQNLINDLNTMLQDFAVSYVPLNQYTQTILDLGDEDTRINALITTLNSNFSDGLSESNAQIIELQLTKASKDEVVAQIIQTISAQLADNNSSIGATIGRIDQAIANETSARATSFQVLTSSLEDTNLDVTANATATSALNTYVGLELGAPNGTGLLADVEILQKQNDGVIETTTGTYDVMISPENPDLAQLVVTAEPYVTWKASDVTGMDTRLSHIGDVYVKYADTANGAKEYIASYKFIRTVIDSTSPYATDTDGFTWALIVDQAAQDAYEQALNAFDLADNKRRVFVATPFVPYDIGDLWLVQVGATIIGTTQGGRVIQVGDMLRCAETKTGTGLYEHNDWIPADSYREGMNAIQTDLNSWRTGTYAPFVISIQSQVDGKAETFYQNSVPTGRIKSTNVASNSTLDKYVGDLWKNTYIGTISGYLGDNTEYVYTKIANGSNWNYDWTKMEVPDIVFDTIDTKKSIYSGNSIPVAIAPDVIEVNDMWITGSDVVAGYDKESIYVWNGSIWIKPLKYTDDTATVALQTGLADGTVTVKLTNAYVGTTPFLTYLTNEIDSKVGVYSGETAPAAGQPSGVAANDIYLWFTTASKVLANGTTQVYDITRTYKYSGSVWNEITTDSNITALADLADGKRTVFSGSTVPVGAVARDIWIPSTTNGSYLQGEIYQYSGAAWVVATKYSADLEAVRSNLQSQVDGKVETYYQATVPTGMASVNNGDYWYCTADVSTYKKGKVYKYVHATTSWIETADVSRYAFDTADGKASIFTSTNVPTTGYKVNDMLIVIGSFNNGTTTFSDGVVLSSNTARTTGFTASDWVKKINDTEDLYAFVDNTYTPTVTNLQNQIDGKIESWYTASTSDPKTAWTDAQTRAKHDGDMWYQTDTKLSYYYSSSTNSWNLIDDAKAIQALENAATAQATADGKISSYYMSTLADAQTMSTAWTATEKTNNVGDLVVVWNDTILDNNGTWRWNGTSWVTTRDKKLVALASDVTALSTELDNGTNTWASADSTLENSLLTEITDEGARVESKFAYNSLLSINGIYKKSGFGLTTNYVSGSGTQIDPYVSEFWIDASRFKFTNSNVTGSVAPFTIDASGSQPQITFNGRVTFGSGQVGTIDEAIAAVVETVAVGDKNINITDNLIPTTSLVADTYNSGYQFVGTPTKSMSAGLESFSEAQIILDTGDEVYSPYVDEATIPYYYRFGIKGITNLDRFKIVTIDSSNVVAYNNVTVTMEVGQTLSADNWYTIDGVINPTGGTTVADGDIRDINGVKVGSINNFVIQSGTTKVLLGWIANCTISRMKICKITADTITSDFSSVNGQLVNLQSQIDNVDVSWNSLSGKDVFAQKLGYATYAALESAATAGQTVVVGGKINTELIEVNAINANQINTTGLIAENISANEIVGKTLTGGVINGARINGVIIKASYLDLNGELEVLTNFIISMAMYNANPSLYTDAVYISADNQYRIPSISTIYNSGSATQFYAQDNVVKYMYISDQIRSYNTANVGHNTKAVRIDPKINILTSSTYYYSDRSNVWQEGDRSTLVLPLCSFYINNLEVARCYHYFIASSNGSWQARIFDVQNGNTLSTITKYSGESISFTVAISNGLSITMNINGSIPPDAEHREGIYTYTIKLNQCIVTPINQFTSGNLLHMSYYSYYGVYRSFFNAMEAKTYAYNPASNISINNMI